MTPEGSRRRSRRGITTLLLLVSALVIAGLGWYVTRLLAPSQSGSAGAVVPPAASTTPTPTPTPTPTAPPALSFSAMGDMLSHASVVGEARTPNGYDFSHYFSGIEPVFADSDVVFCNAETPAAGPKYGITGYPAFNAPKELSRDLRATGCSMINLATNHIADKGQSAINDTLDMWESLDPLAVAGANRSPAEQREVRYFEKNGLKVAFLAFADFSNLAPPAAYSIDFYHDHELVTQLMTQARKNADVVIVSAHWGTEDSHEVNADQQKAAQMFADLGADVIIGTGPHVVQKVSMLTRSDGGQTLVWYSIGNMLSTQLHADQLTGGVAQFTVTKDDGKVTVSDIRFVGTFMAYDWPAADRAAGRLSTRHNLRIVLLRDAEQEVAPYGVTVAERMAKLRSWLGTDVPVVVE